MIERPIPYGHQDIDDADVQAVVDALRGEWLTQGPGAANFESRVAERCAAGHAVATNSGTSALHLACRALGVGPGDVVWTSPNTFVASSNCALYCGAKVDFVDIDPNTWNLDPDALRDRLVRTRSARQPLPKVVIPVHFAGQSCDMEAIAELGREFRYRIVEDASHALGGDYRAAPVGSCRYSDITVFSFHPVKIITTGEGGMALTNDAALAERMARLRSHGITRESAGMRDGSQGAWYYEQTDLGFNYRMTDLQAALGSSQLHRLDAFIGARRTLARRYRSELAGLPVRHPSEGSDARSSWHLYVIRVSASDRGRLFESLRAQGIGVNVHYLPVHLQPYYQDLGFRAGDFPEAEAHGREALTLPLYPSMGEDDQGRVIRACLDWYGANETLS
jgi:UDP-4-amino-4,6-dideoxy-N-acetyl-beta-L-altrosamine transaminase